jgi:hypothetical protein
MHDVGLGCVDAQFVTHWRIATGFPYVHVADASILLPVPCCFCFCETISGFGQIPFYNQKRQSQKAQSRVDRRDTGPISSTTAPLLYQICECSWEILNCEITWSASTLGRQRIVNQPVIWSCYSAYCTNTTGLQIFPTSPITKVQYGVHGLHVPLFTPCVLRTVTSTV